VNERDERNIVLVVGLGDMTNDASTTQWAVVDTAFDILDAGNVPYGFAVGNHDQNPNGLRASGLRRGRDHGQL